jgi:hypothetical protein
MLSTGCPTKDDRGEHFSMSAPQNTRWVSWPFAEIPEPPPSPETLAIVARQMSDLIDAELMREFRSRLISSLWNDPQSMPRAMYRPYATYLVHPVV